MKKERELQRAYEQVLEDMLAHGPNLFQGIYDAKNGNSQYMYGIESVVEYIAYKASEQAGQDMSDTFTKNLLLSEERAESREEE